MRNDHVFYGLVGGRYPTPDELEYHVRQAHRLRAEAAHELFAGLARRIAGLFRRQPAARLQRC